MFVPVAAMALVLVSGCASFSAETAPRNWQPAPALSPENPPNPQLPGLGTQGDGQRVGQQPADPTSVPPPRGCQDFNPAVIATCLNPISAVATIPGTDSNPVGLVAERTTGRIMRVQSGQQASQVAVLPVDPAGDGGLTGLAVSPTYAQDQLLFAYVTTPTDNRVVRIAPGDVPKPVLTGIPRGTTDNRGVLGLDQHGELLVATGDTGNPAAANDPTSLAGKVLRIDVDGAPAPGNPVAASAVVASGLTDPGGICSSLDGNTTWVTDRSTSRDALYRLTVGQPLGNPAWTWPDRPGIAGCAAFTHSVMLAASLASDIQTLALNKDGSFSGQPRISLSGSRGFGRITGIDIIDDNGALAGTANKDGGSPVSSDDRALLILGSTSTGAGQD